MKARVAHLDSSPGGGVERKLRQQAAIASEMGLGLEFRALAGADDRRGRWSPLSILRDNLSNLRQIGDALATCDMAILRFPKVPLGLLLAAARQGGRIITEHHTDEIAELRAGRSFKRAVLACAVRLASRYVLGRVAGIIGVTNEIRRLEVAKAGRRPKPSATVTNGIDVGATGFTRFVPFDGRTLKLVMVASSFQTWQGCDRLLDGLRVYGEGVSIELALIGSPDRELVQEAERINAQGRHIVRIVGPVYGSDLERRMGEATLAVGSLAVHRKGMREACALKVREYAARGIPFIYAYDDSDIPADAAFALKMDGNDSPIDIGRVVEFAARVTAGHGISQDMREFSRRRLDWRSRLEQMYDFACGLVRDRA